MEFRKLTAVRAVLAVTSSAVEEAGIWAIWRFLLPHFDVYLPVGALIAAMVAWLVFSIWLFTFTTWALKGQKQGGPPTMVGLQGTVTERLAPRGMIRIKNEFWTARTRDGEIEKGEEVMVVAEDGLLLDVTRSHEATR